VAKKYPAKLEETEKCGGRRPRNIATRSLWCDSWEAVLGCVSRLSSPRRPLALRSFFLSDRNELKISPGVSEVLQLLDLAERRQR